MSILVFGMLLPFVLMFFNNAMAAEIVEGMRHGNFSYAILIVSMAMLEATISAHSRTRRALTDKLQELAANTSAYKPHRGDD